MRTLAAIVKGIDFISKWTGNIVRWLTLLLIGGLCYEVFARYALNAPTRWAFDVTYMVFGTLFMLGAAYTLLVDEHVRVDIIHSMVSPKTRDIIEIIGYLIFFFPAIGLLLYSGAGYAWESWEMGERAKESVFSPPIYPFKTVLPVAAFLLLIQGIAKFARCLINLVKGNER